LGIGLARGDAFPNDTGPNLLIESCHVSSFVPLHVHLHDLKALPSPGHTDTMLTADIPTDMLLITVDENRRTAKRSLLIVGPWLSLSILAFGRTVLAFYP
jgi:hypothetical protein